jgi:hypothetical protein
MYYGCATNVSCTPENIPLTAQVTNPVAFFAADNNGVIVNMPNLMNANGDASVSGQIIFGLGTQSDNALPATGLSELGTDAQGRFSTNFNGSTTAEPALIDSGADAFFLGTTSDPNLVSCTGLPPQNGAWIGYFCPTVAPESVFAVNTSAASTSAVVVSGSDTVNFAIDDPNTFSGVSGAFINLAAGGGGTTFNFGMPFFYGRKIYIGIEGKAAGSITGPYFAY